MPRIDLAYCFRGECTKRYYLGTATVVLLATLGIVGRLFGWLHVVSFGDGVIVTLIFVGMFVGFLLQLSAFIDLLNYDRTISKEFQSVLQSYEPSMRVAPEASSHIFDNDSKKSLTIH